MAEDSLQDFMNAGSEEESSAFKDSDDFYKMYLEELEAVPPCTPEEEKQLLNRLAAGDKGAAARLAEGKLRLVLEMADSCRERGLHINDLIQEANVAMMTAISEYRDGDLDELIRSRVRETLEIALSDQDREKKIEEEMAARVNVLKDISSAMAEELGREATVEELAERMKMTTDEIKDIMKLTLDAMSVVAD